MSPYSHIESHEGEYTNICAFEILFQLSSCTTISKSIVGTLILKFFQVISDVTTLTFIDLGDCQSGASKDEFHDISKSFLIDGFIHIETYQIFFGAFTLYA